jgi:hypothetical protein
VHKLVKQTQPGEGMLPAILVLLSSVIGSVDILPYQGSTLTLLIIAAIAVVALAFFRLIVPLIIAAVIVIVLLILIFGGIPVPSLLQP